MRGVSVFEKSLRDQKWQILGFGLALAVIGALDVWIWPSYRNTLQNFDLPPALQAFLGSQLSIATSAGFLSAEFFSWIPILLIVYAVIQGTGAIAGEESGGTMDLLLAQPLGRRALVLQKVAAVVVGSVLIVAIGCVGFAASIPFVEIDVTLGDTIMASLNMLPITLLFFALSLWAGAVAPSRAVASGGAIALATAAYFINTLATGVEALRNLKYATPFYYYGSGLPLVEGINWSHAGLLSGIALVLIVLTVRSFERRDVSAGGGADVDVFGVLRRMVARETTS
jgi:ABC-2 type transport system permease protein